ncbi:hypothetical protein J7E38_09040 [Bacillus sp. ISL-35]|uniref:hypothetical protein n=1 Tax=Bacillus sp. ISL-35 TaxID=2819122 RepID=UPI001BEBA62A|nr:hypothetical protein [Bacillus sp. ISL-35]MBT2679148.1 hypothetical protein [Bacillus sp. ISL-35]MBT2702769.1 hypothetical protein [Chryseobacterium sp. ISL-80]
MGYILKTADSSFHGALYQLWGSAEEQKKHFREMVLEEAAMLLEENKGLEYLYGYASIFESAGVFAGTVWEDLKGLNPSLTRGTLMAGGSMAAAEALSNLRILALARGVYANPEMTSKEAAAYLENLLALNVDILALGETKKNQKRWKDNDDCAGSLMRYLASCCFSAKIFDLLEQDITNLLAQRPIIVREVISMVNSACNLAHGNVSRHPTLQACQRSLFFPSELARRQGDYLQEIKNAGDLVLLSEASQLRDSMLESGLVSTYHDTFLQYISKEKPYFLEIFFGKSRAARAALKRNFPLIRKITEEITGKEASQSIYGLYHMFERQVFSAEVVRELEAFVCDHSSKVNPLNENSRNRLTRRDQILTGLISILGHPLGAAQGFNPTCQSTRLLSYLSQKYPHKLISMARRLLTSGEIELQFEGQAISSSSLVRCELKDLVHIDSLSAVMLPHLDAIYGEMLKRAAGRDSDPHKWVNSQFHMAGVFPGFAERNKNNEHEFVALFHHFYFAGADTIKKHLPQPAGILMYDRKGNLLGPHAILIQRVEAKQDGDLRVYFFNPNNDSLQHWYNGVMTSVRDNGEQHGEASLRFEDFIKCLYAFHFPDQSAADQ